MKTPEELLVEAKKEYSRRLDDAFMKNEALKREEAFDSIFSRAIRLAQVEAWREAADITEDLLQEHLILGAKLTAQGLDERIKKIRAKADAIEANVSK